MERILPALPLLLACTISRAEARFDKPVDLELALVFDGSRSVDAAVAAGVPINGLPITDDGGGM